MSWPELPRAWEDLISGLLMLGEQATSAASPLHCEHDTLYVSADASKFSADQLRLLSSYGFLPDEHGHFYSFRFGSA